MPGMPEVETLRRDLDTTMRGARIESVTVLWPPFVGATRAVLDTAVVGHPIVAIRRRGKALLLDLGRDWHLMLHLKMTGQIVVHQRGRVVALGGHPTANMIGPVPNPWTQAAFTLSAGRTLFVNDQRRFARLRVVTTADLAADRFLSSMGPEIRSRQHCSIRPRLPASATSTPTNVCTWLALTRGRRLPASSRSN